MTPKQIEFLKAVKEHPNEVFEDFSGNVISNCYLRRLIEPNADRWNPNAPLRSMAWTITAAGERALAEATTTATAAI